MFNRRSLLKASGAGLLAAGLPLSFGASANPLVSGKLKFLFVFAGGVLPSAFLRQLGVAVDTKFGTA